jgi:hypothetical protein
MWPGMNERTGESRHAAEATEVLSAVRFQEELRRVTRFRVHPPVGDPLDAAVKRIEQHPAYAQSRLLARMLVAISYGRGEFRRAEIAAFDSETLALIMLLIDSHASGASTREEWVRAVDAATAAQCGVGA